MPKRLIFALLTLGMLLVGGLIQSSAGIGCDQSPFLLKLAQGQASGAARADILPSLPAGRRSDCQLVDYLGVEREEEEDRISPSLKDSGNGNFSGRITQAIEPTIFYNYHKVTGFRKGMHNTGGTGKVYLLLQVFRL